MLYQLSYSRQLLHACRSLVGRGGFEPPKASPTDLQSVPFDHSGTSPAKLGYSVFYFSFAFFLPMELAKGLEPPTSSLQVRCSTVELRQQPDVKEKYVNAPMHPIRSAKMP
jgi:hypothetical protein